MNLDDVIPEPDHRTRHSHVVGAPPEVVWDELHRVTMSALPLGRTLEAMRLLPLGSPAGVTSRWPDGRFST